MCERGNTAVKNTILNLLAASETNYDYPALQSDAADIISSNLSDIVYTTLKQKSIASSTKRCNLLKFINNICKTPEAHLAENHYKVYLNRYKQEFCKTDPEVEDLYHSISEEVNTLSTDLHSQVSAFYNRKNAKRKQKMKKQEFIKQLDEERLSPSLGVHLSKNVSHYETSMNLVDDLLKETLEDVVMLPVTVYPESKDYRENQVQFCYALINIGNDGADMEILQHILQKFTLYAQLERFEIKLLMDLWLMGDHLQLDFSKIVTEKFPFVVEKMVLEFCTDIIKLEDNAEITKYFSDLSSNSKIVRLRDVCTKNLGFYFKLKNLIFKLYVSNNCNENVYRFIDYII